MYSYNAHCENSENTPILVQEYCKRMKYCETFIMILNLLQKKFFYQLIKFKNSKTYCYSENCASCNTVKTLAKLTLKVKLSDFQNEMTKLI